MKYLAPIILSLQLIVNPRTIDDIEKNDSSKVAMINVTKSILIDNSGIRHWYIGGITRGDIHYCNVHNIYEKVDIKW
tara:strand:+ start:478 stop:708 length:231 start_codon:yes stop_codon:yes gene_type:complete